MIDDKLITRFETLTGHKASHLLRRHIFFAHKDFNKILNDYEAGKEIYIYTGRGPSSSAMHIGHLMPFMFTKYLQDVFKAIVVIQIADDEKFYFKEGKLEDYEKMGKDNVLDIMACGFDKERTYIFSNSKTFGGSLYNTTAKIMKSVTGNQIKGIYGITLDDNIGKMIWPAMQCAPAFSSSFPPLFKGNKVRCLVPMAIDQDPYFRMARDFAHKYRKDGYLKPSIIHCKFIPSLTGLNGKMSSSTMSNMTIFLSDTPNMIKKKINKFAFSGGKDTIEEHRKLGANIEVDVTCNILKFFLEDDERFNDIIDKYKTGKMLSGEIKKILIDVLQSVVLEHQNRKKEMYNYSF